MARQHVRILGSMPDVDLVGSSTPTPPVPHSTPTPLAATPEDAQRIADSVVFDLMVHDLDLACWIAGGYPRRIEAVGTKVFSDLYDAASAVLEFPGGCIASLQSSRATQDKVRRISVSERDRFLVADSIRQDVSIKRETTVEFTDETGGMYRQANVVEVPYLDRSGEPLARELRDVIDAIRSGRPPLVGGAAGVNAVRLAHDVERAASSR